MSYSYEDSGVVSSASKSGEIGGFRFGNIGITGTSVFGNSSPSIFDTKALLIISGIALIGWKIIKRKSK